MLRFSANRLDNLARYVPYTFMPSGRFIPDPSRLSASARAPTDWPVVDDQLARFEAQLMQLAEMREIAHQRLRRLFRRMASARRAGLPRSAAMVAEGRRLMRALHGIQKVEDFTINRRKTRIAELGIVHQ